MRFPAVRSAVAIAALALALTGCSEEGDPMSPGPGGDLPSSVPQATTPANALTRFEATWEYGAVGEYDKLLAGNFRFTFSPQSDPDLANAWGVGWSRADELAAASNLKFGFIDGEGEAWPAATLLALVLANTTIIADPDRPDSAAWYKVAVVQAFNASIDLVGGIEVVISAPQDIHLVRGDAAVLAPGQEARTDRWYVSRWVDKSPAPPTSSHAAVFATWGSLKDAYR